MNASVPNSSSGLALRAPETVMIPHRVGAMHQTRISFVRSLIRRMANENWQLTTTRWDLSEQGFGTVIYRLETPTQHYHQVIFSDQIADDERNDRVIAEKWDVTFALVRGDVDDDLLEQLRSNVPLQEAGRNTNKVLVLSRANKSMRVFGHLLSALAQGQQPDRDILASVGYILRTTAVYGNGKFGIADFETLRDNPDFNLSFSAQMCAVYLLRHFSLEWVHYLAKQQGGEKAVTLHPDYQRYLGVGNATGLGMAPYLINHPRVVDQWLTARELALAGASENVATQDIADRMSGLLDRAAQHLQQVVTIDDQQRQLNHHAVDEIKSIIESVHESVVQQKSWQALIESNEQYSFEAQEVAISCLLECYPEHVDQYALQMNADETLSLSRGVTIGQLKEVLQTRYQWALDIDFNQPDSQYWFWYVSEDKEEPRLGIRNKEPGAEREQPLDIARQASNLFNAIKAIPETQSLSEFLLQSPQYRVISRRVWTLGHCSMGDIQMNVLDKQSLPMHLLRGKLSMFGATKFDPRSDRWVRVTLFQGAPLMNELHDGEWLFPLLPDLESSSS